MTDKEKLEKLVAYLGRRMYAHNLMADIGSTGEIFDEKIENAKYEECRDTLNFIDSLQKEPKKCMYTKDHYTDEDRKVLCDGCEEECKYSKSEDFTKALAECIHQAQGNVVDPMVLAETWKDELIKLAKSEEPISEELDEAAKIYARGEYDRKNPSSLPLQCKGCYSPLIYAFKDGAQWQKEQFEKNRLKHCDGITNEQAELEQGFIDQHLDKHNRMPTFLDAIEYGMRLQKEQMMAKAIDAHCFGFQGAALFSFRLPASNYLVGSEVKVIVLKED